MGWIVLERFSLQKEPGRLVRPGYLPLRQQQNRDRNPGLCSMCTGSEACIQAHTHIQAHRLALHWIPGTAAEASLRVKSCIALPSTDSMPIQLTQVCQKGDQISNISSSLWALSLSIPLGNSALLFCVSSYHNADCVSLLFVICFTFLVKRKRNVLLFTLWEFPCYCLLLHFHYIVLLLLSAKWC